MDDSVNPDELAREKLYEVLQALRDCKPTERGELARRYAVTITEMEKVIGYFQTFVVEKLYLEP